MNIKGIRLLTDAVGDLEDGKLFYDRQRPGAGDYFWDSLIADLESLILYAGVHARESGYYRMLSRRFPYAVYYEIRRSVVYVVAILPMRRNPARLREILNHRQ
jgi:plasmid stabilization system protein ParE